MNGKISVLTMLAISFLLGAIANGHIEPAAAQELTQCDTPTVNALAINETGAYTLILTQPCGTPIQFVNHYTIQGSNAHT